MTPHPGNHILPHYDLALNNIQTRVNCVCESLLDHMAVLEHVISDADMNGANGIIADDELLDEETRQILSLCSAVLIQFTPSAPTCAWFSPSPAVRTSSANARRKSPTSPGMPKLPSSGRNPLPRTSSSPC